MEKPIEESVPAFSMWKMFNDTIIPALLKMEYSESSLQKLASIVKTKEFLNIFVYNRDPTLNYVEYKAITNKYEIFTVWLLGRFFYFLSCDKLSSIHTLIVETQWRILQRLCVTQTYLYEDLSRQYAEALRELNGYSEGKLYLSLESKHEDAELNAKLDLSIFKIEISTETARLNMTKYMIKLVEQIINENLLLNFFNAATDLIIDCLLHILSECNIGLKLLSLEVYCNLLKEYQLNKSEMPVLYVEKFSRFIGYLEPLVYDFYNKKIDATSSECTKFESILTRLFDNVNNLDDAVIGSMQNISAFLMDKEVTESLQLSCCEQFTKLPLLSLQVKAITDLIIEKKMYNLMTVIQKQLMHDVQLSICTNQSNSRIYLFNDNFHYCRTWIDFSKCCDDKLKTNWCKINCCQYLNSLTLIRHWLEMLIQLAIEVQNYIIMKGTKMEIDVVSTNVIFEHVQVIMHAHQENCGLRMETDDVNDLLQNIFAMCSLSSLYNNVEVAYYCIAFPFVNKSDYNCMFQFEHVASYLSKQNINKRMSIRNLAFFMNIVSSGLVEFNKSDDIDRLLNRHIKVVKNIINDGNTDGSYHESLYNLLEIPPNFNNKNQWINQILLSALDKDDELLLTTAIKASSNIICKSYSKYIPLITWNKKEKRIETETFCLKCLNGVVDDSTDKTILLKSLLQKYTKSKDFKCLPAAFNVFDNLKGISDGLSELFQRISLLFSHDDLQVKVEIVKALNSFLHLESFHTVNIAKLWLKFAIDDDQQVREEFELVISSLLQNILNFPSSLQNKEEILKACFIDLKAYMKKSLQKSSYDLQKTLLETIRSLSRIKVDSITLNVSQLLLYFIMMPTSKYSLIASSIFISMASNYSTTTNLIYSQYKKELSQTIVELCAINQALLNYNLSTSLEKISLILGYFGPKDFVTQECRYLLPIFISLIITMPKVETLIHEIAAFVETDLSELLITRYGNIFLQLFLNKSDEGFKQSMRYIEKKSGLKGSVLRKRNSQVILNELLLNLHEKRDRVLLGIRILAHEDSDSQLLSVKQIPEYLQPKLLGVLSYFDMKLLARSSTKKKVLLSLAQLLRFMGPRYITALRFKILAMLKTALSFNNETFPELNCDVWDAFVRSCDIDALGPQLASIFVSLIPLMQHFHQKIDDIFKYLIIENEIYIKDYIPDLFFVVDANVNHEICIIIKKYLGRIENSPFKEQLRWTLKYLNHETMEIRVHGLKHLKKLLEKNREELDRMILGYNGIDPMIVELLDILMLRCREKEDIVKLACGECIGELGAIEPSHLPRQYTQESKSFTFFITEDAFIVNALNELTRALQEEGNTQSMDRFALAIQEILKVHGISPDVNSPKHNLWVNFPEAQRELMLPLLSSRYTMVQPVESIPMSPIYGSKYGGTFQTWIYNWTCNLILAIKSDKRALLQVCLPSLKQDTRMLMSFLPHILLHALLENREIHQNAYEEFVAVISSFSNKCGPQLGSRILNVKSATSTVSQTVSTEESKENQCTKVTFVLLDFLERWRREWTWEKGDATSENGEYKTIQDFLLRFCKLQLARCNYYCGEYPRALMYLEEYIKEQPDTLSNQFSFLSELYAQIDEPDGVAGITALQDTEPPLEQRLLALEVSGKLADAAACYERIHPPLKPHHIHGLVKCYLDLDNVNTALNLVEGAVTRQPEYKDILLEYEVEPLWRLSRFDELDNLLKKPELQNNNNWGVQMGRALLNLKNGNRVEFKNTLDALSLAQVESLGAASLEEGAYQHGYSYISKLHAINELQQIENMIYELTIRPNDHKVCETLIKQLTSEWELRLKIVQESIRIQEPILCLRRVSIEQAKRLLENKVSSNCSPLLNSLLGESWLHSAKIARAAGIHQQAYTYTLKAEEYAPPRLFLEKARLHWLREEHEQALTTLRRGVELLIPENINTPGSSYGKMSIENRKIAAEAKLLIASYNDSISNVDTDINTQHYKESIDVFKEWEKGLVCLAQYYDRIFQTFSDEDKDAKGSDIQIHMINYFGKSLAYGTKFVYQSMPRLLSIWFDYGTRLLDVTDSRVKEERSNMLLKMTKLIDMFLERLPCYIFLTAFSQLVSRICHPQKQVYMELKTIIIKLILQYPQQSLWMIISVIKSSYSVRSRRCAEILNDSRLKTASMIKLVGDFTKLAEKLIELCNKEIPDNVQVTSVNSLLRSLPRLLTKDDFSEIMIPTQKFRKLILPNPDFQSCSQHNPFPNHYVHIVGIEDEITILQSLQHPRKITFRGSDGNLYVQMLKPKDDLRKDFRLMEFNDIVNQLLSREPESRQRRLNIRLYSVVPLNEECGLIEWVPNMVGLRPVLMKLYKQMGIVMKVRELKQYCCNQRDSLLKKREVFLKCLIPRHPPVLNEWFRKTFPDAQSWLTARTAYIRTTAVMSMVGYIVGLGDRHGENILFDSVCGDTMHVDFNCLFNKGESFEWPERVPFRLTHNMVTAMGSLGVEGVFRKSCACTLRVLRSNSTTLMSIVTPFVYDPLVSWPRNALAAANAQTSELTNEKAMDHIRNIELRLQGIIKTKGRSSTIPLSVDGQTNNLIQEAMSIDNLCQMYFGWGPYL